MADKALERLGGFVASAEPQPSAASLEFVRHAIIDNYACMLAGAGQTVTQKTIRALIGSGQVYDSAPARIYGSAYRANAAAAAMLNAISAHSLDFDDWEVPGNTHISAVLLPALLAASATQKLPGKSLLDAYLVGFEVVARIGEAINLEHYAQGWHASATLGAIGAAAAVARLRGLDAAQSTNALAIACSRGLGYNAQFGSEAKPLQVGFAVEGGLLAACLAAEGLVGQAHMLEHSAGMLALMSHGQMQRLQEPMQRLGRELALDQHGIVFKPWPSCGYSHRIMTGMLEMHERIAEPGQIDSIELHLPQMHAAILPFAQPANRSEALFSLPYCASMALLYGRLTIADIDAQSWLWPEVRQLIAKTSIHPFAERRPELNYDPLQPDRILVYSGDHNESVEIAYPLGAPQKPMTQQQHYDKFYACCALQQSAAEEAWQSLLGWPEVEDIHSLLTA